VTDEAELLDVALDAARLAGGLLADRFASASPGAVETKSSPTDPVSEADTASEQAIRALLAARRPDDAILGEEGDDVQGTSGLRWVVDPLDGTVNFLYGLPAWSVTLACQESGGSGVATGGPLAGGRTLAGVVFDPLREETFAATASGPPTRNGVAFSPPRATSVAQALVGTGFGYAAERRVREGAIATRVLGVARDLRRIGSAAVELAWTACGRLDAFYERGLNPWDAAAGVLICARAGLEVRPLEPQDGLPAGLIVAPAAIVDELAAVVGG
jgi:myo-inositol-1(or 4)-monophosphatase